MSQLKHRQAYLIAVFRQKINPNLTNLITRMIFIFFFRHLKQITINQTTIYIHNMQNPVELSA